MAFADEFAANLLQNPNYYNPLYASERQKKAQEDYATALMKRSTEGATRPTGVLAAMIDQLTSNMYRNASLNQEQAQYGDLQRRLQQQNTETQSGGGYAPALMRQGEVQQPEPPANVATGGAVPKNMAAVQQAYSQGNNADGTRSLNLTAGEAPAAIEQPPANATLSDDMIKQRLLAHGQRIASLGPAGGAPSTPPSGAPAPPQPSPVVGGGAAAPPNFAQRFTQAFPNSPGYSPANNAAIQVNPMASPEVRGVAAGIFKPEMGQDVYGNPIVQSPGGGVNAMGVGPGVTPGFRAPVTISPEGITAPSVVPAPGRGAPPSGPILGGGQGGVSAATNLTSQLRMAADKSKAVSAIQTQDVETANQAPLIRQIAGTMRDDLMTAKAKGQPLPFGPTANWQNEVKRVAADLAPGVMKSQLESLAAADSFDKMSSTLTGILAGSNRSDAALFNNMKSVPGSHNSMEGADALLQMVIQRANQQEGMRQFITQNSRTGTPDEYLALKDEYFKRNPITNPLSGHPIAMDLAGSAKSARENPASGPPVGYQKFYDGSMHTFKGGDWRDKKNWDSGS
jgi:hypothetical protein